MGNGFPVAGVAVVHDAVADFGRDTRYFNTFGGNTMAVAAAQATLHVIRDEDLLANARRVGGTLRGGLTELAQRYEPIGDVRGAGLYLGIDTLKIRPPLVFSDTDAAHLLDAIEDVLEATAGR